MSVLTRAAEVVLDGADFVARMTTGLRPIPGVTAEQAERAAAELDRRFRAASHPPGPSRSRTHLVVGDCHAAPNQDLRRFAWLGRMVRELRPDVLIQIGDWYSLDSLCHHRSMGERATERAADDIRAGREALELFEREARGWQGRKILTLGNHDDRLRQLADDAPWLEGLHNVGAEHEAHGWEVAPFLAPVRVDGVRYQHYLRKAGGKQAISGEYHAQHLLKRVAHQESVVVGHSHFLRHAVFGSRFGRRHGLVVGCYFEHAEDYAGDENDAWWRGVCVLRDVRGGDFDLETWSLERIRARWG